MLLMDLKDVGLLLGKPHDTSKDAIAYVNTHLKRYTCVLIRQDHTALVIERQWTLSPLLAQHTKRLPLPFTLQELDDALLSVRKAPLCP